MGISITTPPSGEPLSIDELKVHCNIDSDEDDDYLVALIGAARGTMESVTGRQFMRATYTVTLDRFPVDDYIELPGAPLHEITSISYVDSAGATQTFNSANYDVDNSTEPGRIYVDRGVGWPATANQRRAVTIVYTCGYEDADAVPERIKHLLRFLCGHWYENREASTAGIAVTDVPISANYLIGNLKVRGTLNSITYGLYG